jgi:hypothetical protein
VIAYRYKHRKRPTLRILAGWCRQKLWFSFHYWLSGDPIWLRVTLQKWQVVSIATCWCQEDGGRWERCLCTKRISDRCDRRRSICTLLYQFKSSTYCAVVWDRDLCLPPWSWLRTLRSWAWPAFCTPHLALPLSCCVCSQAWFYRGRSGVLQWDRKVHQRYRCHVIVGTFMVLVSKAVLYGVWTWGCPERIRQPSCAFFCGDWWRVCLKLALLLSVPRNTQYRSRHQDRNQRDANRLEVFLARYLCLHRHE